MHEDSVEVPDYSVAFKRRIMLELAKLKVADKQVYKLLASEVVPA